MYFLIRRTVECFLGCRYPSSFSKEWNISSADYIKSHPELGEEPVDIEDLVTIGKAHGPYVLILFISPIMLIVLSTFLFSVHALRSSCEKSLSLAANTLFLL